MICNPEYLPQGVTNWHDLLMVFYNRHYQQYGVYPTKRQPFRYEVNNVQYEYDLFFVKERAHAELARQAYNSSGCMA